MVAEMAVLKMHSLDDLRMVIGHYPGGGHDQLLVSHGPDLVTVLMEGTTLVEVTILVEVPEQISNLDILFKDTKKSVITAPHC